jgi:hypothetical protein
MEEGTGVEAASERFHPFVPPAPVVDL